MNRQVQTMDIYCPLTNLMFIVNYIEHPPEPDVGLPSKYVEIVDYSLVKESNAEEYVQELLTEELCYA